MYNIMDSYILWAVNEPLVMDLPSVVVKEKVPEITVAETEEMVNVPELDTEVRLPEVAWYCAKTVEAILPITYVPVVPGQEVTAILICGGPPVPPDTVDPDIASAPPTTEAIQTEALRLALPIVAFMA